MEEIMAPKSWDEFCREYRAGRCRVSFDIARTRIWAHNQGWVRTKPYVIGYSLVATVGALASIWLIDELIITIPTETILKILLLAIFGGAGVGWFQSARKCFVARILNSEDAFWLAYRESGVDFYQSSRAVPPILRWFR